MNHHLKTIIKSVITEGKIERKKFDLKQLVDFIKNRVIIFFDTETTGLDPRRSFRLITEIAAVAYDTSTGQRLGEYSKKAHLTDPVKQRMEKEKQRKEKGEWPKDKPTIEDLLKMTAYHEGDVPYEEEKEMMKGFLDFVNSFADKNPILVAHNAKFDMYQVGKALETHGLPKMPRYNVADSVVIAREYLFPLLVAQEKEAKGTLNPESELAHLLKAVRPQKRFSAKLISLGQGFKVDTKHWHSAIADTEQLAGILARMIQFFESSY